MFKVESIFIFKNGDFEKTTFGVFRNKRLAKIRICSEIQALRELYLDSVEVTSSDSVYSVILNRNSVYNFIICKI